jgi:hypothetical protein
LLNYSHHVLGTEATEASPRIHGHREVVVVVAAAAAVEYACSAITTVLAQLQYLLCPRDARRTTYQLAHLLLTTYYLLLTTYYLLLTTHRLPAGSLTTYYLLLTTYYLLLTTYYLLLTTYYAPPTSWLTRAHALGRFLGEHRPAARNGGDPLPLHHH